MKLSQKIKHIKRHWKNKYFKDKAETIQWLAMINIEHHNSDRFFIVSPLMYEIIRYYYPVPDNLKCSGFIKDVTEFMMTVPRDIVEYYNDNELNYLKQWCGIPKDADIPFTPGSERNELYMHIDKPIAPDITTLNGVQV